MEIYESTPQNTPGALLDAAFLEDFEEIRDPETNGLTSASYCVYLQQFFQTDLDESYYVSITPQLCGPEQWAWISSNEGDGESAYVLAPHLGYEDWTPTLEVYGEDLNCSMNSNQPIAAVDITYTPNAWMPEFGNTVTYNSKIYWLDPRAGTCVFPGPDKVIRFRLFGSSSEKGYCLNAGLHTHSDLHFNTPENLAAFNPVGAANSAVCDLLNAPHEHWNLMETKTCVIEATITVKSEDYGSWAWIEASAEGCNAVPVENLVPRNPAAGTSCEIGPSTALIPVDLDGNSIADVYPGNETSGNIDPRFDEETMPNPESERTGDGLTRYEEYRGVRTRGAGEPHARLSPVLKEIAVYRQNNAWPAEDIHFSAMVIDITADQMNGAKYDNQGMGTVNEEKKGRILNFNRTSHTARDQHGLWLAVGGTGTQHGHWGRTHDQYGSVGIDVSRPPSEHGRIDVYSATLTADAARRTGTGKRWLQGEWITVGSWVTDGSARANEYIRDTIGHELGHAHGHVHHQGLDRWRPHRPPTSATAFFDVSKNPVEAVRRFSAREEQMDTCVMQYNFDLIRASVGLTQNKFSANVYNTIDPTWLLPRERNPGYGSLCITSNLKPCFKNSKVRND